MNGLKIQWGMGTADSSSGLTISFPVSFSNNNYIIIPTIGYNNSPEPTGYKISSITQSTARIGTSDAAGSLLNWIAIGY